MSSNINKVVFELVYAIGIGYESIIFIWYNFALCNIKHSLPPINNLPLLNHAGYVRIAGVNHLASLLIIFRLIDARLWSGIS